MGLTGAFRWGDSAWFQIRQRSKVQVSLPPIHSLSLCMFQASSEKMNLTWKWRVCYIYIYTHFFFPVFLNYLPTWNCCPHNSGGCYLEKCHLISFVSLVSFLVVLLLLLIYPFEVLVAKITYSEYYQLSNNGSSFVIILSVYWRWNNGLANCFCTPQFIISHEWYATGSPQWCSTSTSHFSRLAYSFVSTSCCSFCSREGERRTNRSQRGFNTWRQEENNFQKLEGIWPTIFAETVINHKPLGFWTEYIKSFSTRWATYKRTFCIICIHDQLSRLKDFFATSLSQFFLFCLVW